MERVKIIRYADEGFVNYQQHHIRSVNSPVVGCYAFIEDEQIELLEYKEEYLTQFPNAINRSRHKKIEKEICGKGLVWVKNRVIHAGVEEIYISQGKDIVVIPEEPILKYKMIQEEAFPVSMDVYVQVSLSFAYERYKKLSSLYKWLRDEKEIMDEASVNTSLIDYCECIIDCKEIFKS